MQPNMQHWKANILREERRLGKRNIQERRKFNQIVAGGKHTKAAKKAGLKWRKKTMDNSLLVAGGKKRNPVILEIHDDKYLSKFPYAYYRGKHIRMQFIKELALSRNKIERIPPLIKHFKKLQIINLSHNQLREISPEIWKLKRLEELNLSHNQLTRIPPVTVEGDEFGELSLRILDVSFNQLSKIPQGLEWFDLEQLHLNNNPIQGAIPETFDNMKSLQYINIKNTGIINVEALQYLVGDDMVLSPHDVHMNPLYRPLWLMDAEEIARQPAYKKAYVKWRKKTMPAMERRGERELAAAKKSGLNWRKKAMNAKKARECSGKSCNLKMCTPCSTDEQCRIRQIGGTCTIASSLQLLRFIPRIYNALSDTNRQYLESNLDQACYRLPEKVRHEYDKLLLPYQEFDKKYNNRYDVWRNEREFHPSYLLHQCAKKHRKSHLEHSTTKQILGAAFLKSSGIPVRIQPYPSYIDICIRDNKDKLFFDRVGNYDNDFKFITDVIRKFVDKIKEGGPWIEELGEEVKQFTYLRDLEIQYPKRKSWVVFGPCEFVFHGWKEKAKTLEGHSDYVNSVAIDGDRIVSGSADKTIKIWNTEGECIKTLEGHSDCVTSVAIDGDRIVSGSWDETIKIWNMNTGECLKTLEGHSEYVISVAIDGDRIVSGSRDITIWGTGKSLADYITRPVPVPLVTGLKTIEKIAIESGAVGGWISVRGEKGKKHSLHAISFTVCKNPYHKHTDKIIIRNSWSKYHTIHISDLDNGMKFAHFDSVVRFSLLIPPDV